MVSTNRNDQPMTPEEVDGMNAQHTPGPWQYDEDSLRPGWYSIYHNGPLAYCGDTTAEPGDGEANARLIAAAPDLLAAARLTLRLLEDLTAEQYSRGEDQPARDALRAAIEKAVGPEVPA